MIQPNPKPGLRRHLQSPADAISDDVGVTNDDLVRVLFLRLSGLGKVLLEGALDSGTVGAKLGGLGLPEIQRRFGGKRSAFLQQLVHGNGHRLVIHISQLVNNDFRRFSGPRHGGRDDGVISEADFAKSTPGQFQLLAAEVGKPLITVTSLSGQVVAMPNKENVSRALAFILGVFHTTR